MSNRLSPHFTVQEMTATSVRGFDNSPDVRQLQNLRRLCGTVLEPLRLRFGPLHTNSGYRCHEVNRVVGGSHSSAHLCIGFRAAWDGIPLKEGVTLAEMLEWVLDPASNIQFDQVIYEGLGSHWLHIGIDALERNRRQALMIFEHGRYEPWSPNDPRVRR